jgi:hypothetical protein
MALAYSHRLATGGAPEYDIPIALAPRHYVIGQAGGGTQYGIVGARFQASHGNGDVASCGGDLRRNTSL